MAARSIIVIGAGIGGLSTAIRLRSAGYAVTIYEKNPRVGGKMYEIERDGFRFDTGPSVITMRHVFEELFATAGRNLDDYITLEPIEPMTRYFWRDGTIFDASSNLTKMAQQIAQLDERDVEGYFEFLAYAARIHRITGDVFIYDRPPRPSSFTKVPPWDWLKADPFRTMSAAANRFIRTPKLRQLLGRFATYVGGNPYLAPATLNVIAHVELTGGVWYPRGGIYNIAAGMERLARELGVQICCDHPVREIAIQDGQVQGVHLENGTFAPAEVVVANSDVATTYNHLLPTGAIPQRKIDHRSNYEPSCSGFVMLLGIDRTFDDLIQHNIFFSDDYRAEFDAIFGQLRPPDDPTIYVSITSKTDPAHAPDGGENWFVLVNAPPLSDQYDWETQKGIYRDRILANLAARGYDVRDHIVSETIWTPRDLETHSGAWRGALYGPSANDRLAVFLRPHNRSRDVKGLYFAGGTTHPGGGVPMVTLSGKVAAELVAEDFPQQ